MSMMIEMYYIEDFVVPVVFFNLQIWLSKVDYYFSLLLKTYFQTYISAHLDAIDW